MGKKVAIVQSCYIPWKGYFDMIGAVDEFILFDDVQYVKRTWRNRNKIKTSNGIIWLTIPVKVSGKFNQAINEVEVEGDYWRKKHWRSIQLAYKKAKHFKNYTDIFEKLYLDSDEKKLSLINKKFIEEINKILGISTSIKFSSDYNYQHKEGEISSIIELLKNANATKFINGPTAKAYMGKEMFSSHDIDLIWMDYSGYQEYSQLFPPFEHSVSIIDLIFNEGENAKNYLKYVRGNE